MSAPLCDLTQFSGNYKLSFDALTILWNSRSHMDYFRSSLNLQYTDPFFLNSIARPKRDPVLLFGNFTPKQYVNETPFCQYLYLN